MMIMCDECDSIWLATDLSGEPYFPESSEYFCPYGHHKLYAQGAHWASKDEIVQKGWWRTVIGESSTRGEN
jgi:hypothetical protein